MVLVYYYAKLELCPELMVIISPKLAPVKLQVLLNSSLPICGSQAVLNKTQTELNSKYNTLSSVLAIMTVCV